MAPGPAAEETIALATEVEIVEVPTPTPMPMPTPTLEIVGGLEPPLASPTPVAIPTLGDATPAISEITGPLSPSSSATEPPLEALTDQPSGTDLPLPLLPLPMLPLLPALPGEEIPSEVVSVDEFHPDAAVIMEEILLEAAPWGELLADLPAQIGQDDDRTEIRVQFTVDATETQSVIIEISNPTVDPVDLTPSLQAGRQIITHTLPAAPQMGVSLSLSPGILWVDGPPLDEIVWRSLVEKSENSAAAARWRQTPQVWEWIVQGEAATARVPAGVSEVRMRIYQRATESVAFADLVIGFDFPVKLVRPEMVVPTPVPTLMPTPAPTPNPTNEGGSNLVVWGMVIALLLVGGLAVLEIRRRRQPFASPASKPDPAPAPLLAKPSPVITASPIKGYTSLNFSVLRASAGGYKILAKSELDDREAAHNFSLAFEPSYLTEVQSAIQLAGLRAANPSRRVGNREELVLQAFGTRLFDGVVNEDVRDLYMSTVEKARGQEKGVVLRFNFEEVPELSALPWEYLYDTRSRRFLALDSTRPMVRYRRSTASLSVEALAVKPPLRVLVVESRPKGVAELDTATESRSILAALQSDLNLAGKIELEILEDATLGALQGKLRSNSYHVFHFIGHGTYSQGEDIGYLLFEGKNEQPELVPGHILGSLLGDHFPMRLVFLNACEGAAVSATDGDPFRGVATSLVQRNLPAVIAMQSEITDRAAVQLAADFYTALAANYPVDAALAEARKALDYHFPGSLEWGKPVLYLCQQTGQLFDLSE